jgi:hypothetical protein
VRVRDALNDRRNANEALEIDGLDALLARHAALPVPAAAGDALVFHTFLLHRSQPNRSAGHAVDAAGALLRLPQSDRYPPRLGGRHE